MTRASGRQHGDGDRHRPPPVTTIPGPGLYRVKPFEVEALQWLPGDIKAAGAMVSWLLTSGLDFHHPGPGTGSKMKLAIGTGKATRTAQPGDWIVRSEDTFLVVSRALFEVIFQDLEITRRQREAAKAGRRALIEESERHASYCIAHRRRVQWGPWPTWWYHADGPVQIPENHQCRSLLRANAPRGASDASK